MKSKTYALLPFLMLAAATTLAHEPQSLAPSTSTVKSFEELDKNQDDVLTAAELPANDMHAQHFTAIDTDRDGRLSKAEVATHHEAMGVMPKQSTEEQAEQDYREMPPVDQ